MPDSVSNLPDPISQMQHVPSDLGSNLTAGFVKSIDDYINGLIHTFGDYVGAGVNKLVDSAASMGNAVTNIASSAAAPFKAGFVAVAPGGTDSPSRDGHGLGRGITMDSPEQDQGMASALVAARMIDTPKYDMHMQEASRAELVTPQPISAVSVEMDKGRGGISC